nr:MAG TPA: hypothetical protein [Caudoviricetes sp.]DAY32635.1 MAG TPA: hypothetical protein [Caudoviricetes sp.]
MKIDYNQSKTDSQLGNISLENLCKQSKLRDL